MKFSPLFTFAYHHGCSLISSAFYFSSSLCSPSLRLKTGLIWSGYVSQALTDRPQRC